MWQGYLQLAFLVPQCAIGAAMVLLVLDDELCRREARREARRLADTRRAGGAGSGDLVGTQTRPATARCVPVCGARAGLCGGRCSGSNRGGAAVGERERERGTAP